MKLPIQSYVQAKSTSRQQWRNWIGAALLEWEKIQVRIQLHKMYISLVAKLCFARLENFNLLIAWANMWNKMMEETSGVERQNSKKGFEKNWHFCSVEGVFVVLDLTATVCQSVFQGGQPYLENSKAHLSSDRS